MKKSISLLLLIAIIGLVSSQSSIVSNLKPSSLKSSVQKDTVKKNSTVISEQETAKDSLMAVSLKFKLYKKEAHASYYADKFHGRKTASGKIFDMNKYTAAHKKFPFGTMLRVTNKVNGKSVIVEVIDRGPFVKSREIDLSKKAFMEIAKNKGIGVMLVKIEEVVK